MKSGPSPGCRSTWTVLHSTPCPYVPPRSWQQEWVQLWPCWGCIGLVEEYLNVVIKCFFWCCRKCQPADVCIASSTVKHRVLWITFPPGQHFLFPTHTLAGVRIQVRIYGNFVFSISQMRLIVQNIYSVNSRDLWMLSSLSFIFPDLCYLTSSSAKSWLLGTERKVLTVR